MASKSKELAQQSGIIDYINKLSSNASAEAAAEGRSVAAITDADAPNVVAVQDIDERGGGFNATQVPDSEGHQLSV